MFAYGLRSHFSAGAGNNRPIAADFWIMEISRSAALLALLTLNLMAQSRPNFTGTWKLDDAASAAVPKIVHHDPAFQCSASAMRGLMPFNEV